MKILDDRKQIYTYQERRRLWTRVYSSFILYPLKVLVEGNIRYFNAFGTLLISLFISEKDYYHLTYFKQKTCFNTQGSYSR
jgi:hypothetical protein